MPANKHWTASWVRSPLPRMMSKSQGATLPYNPYRERAAKATGRRRLAMVRRLALSDPNSERSSLSKGYEHRVIALLDLRR